VNAVYLSLSRKNFERNQGQSRRRSRREHFPFRDLHRWRCETVFGEEEYSGADLNFRMATDQPNEIPSDYGVVIIFRHFKQTWIHERCFSIGSGNEFRSTMSSGIPWVQFFDSNCELLLCWLREGWPEPILGAQWNHERKMLEVFADDLFLCPECGRFHGLGSKEQNQHDAQRKVLALIQHPQKDIGNPNWSRLDPSDARRLRDFAASRLNVPQFYMQSCKSQFCRQIKLQVIREFKSRLRRRKEQPSPEIRAFLEAKTKPEKPTPSYTSSVYLIHEAGHHKIGIAINPSKRLKGIKTSCPFPVEILKTWKSENAVAVEQAIHRRFAEHRLNGEWFKLPDNVLTTLTKIEDIDVEFLSDNSNQ
jgi:hypothetical protein